MRDSYYNLWCELRYTLQAGGINGMHNYAGLLDMCLPLPIWYSHLIAKQPLLCLILYLPGILFSTNVVEQESYRITYNLHSFDIHISNHKHLARSPLPITGILQINKSKDEIERGVVGAGLHYLARHTT